MRAFIARTLVALSTRTLVSRQQAIVLVLSPATSSPVHNLSPRCYSSLKTRIPCFFSTMGVSDLSASTPQTQSRGEALPVKKAKMTSQSSLGANEVLRVKRLSDKAVIPTRGSEGAAGYDLSSAEESVVPARGKAIVKTDISIAIPMGTYARVAPRSGLAAKLSIDVGAGVVDYDYRGNVGVILFNFSDKDFKVSQGDRVAQLILERIMTPPVEEVEELEETGRGEGGFGSTGVAAK